MASNANAEIKAILPKASLSHADYRVAWLCALPVEMAAARLMLDEVHEDLPRKPLDNNAYILGRVKHHNVVIACLPSGRVGIAPVSEAVSQLRWSFPRSEIGLLVGIGGGAPGPDADVRLGDVVVSHQSGQYGGVVPYDRGKIGQEGRLVPTGFVNGPPTSLLTAVSKVRAAHLTEQSLVFSLYLAAAERQWKSFKPDTSTDILFEASYDHADASSSCHHCDTTRTIDRPERAPPETRVHYGLIASAGYVVKDGSSRETLRQECGALCFEMEAAGLMNILPTLVIRGICDYADSHKNKLWQPYAAIAAASYAKEVLEALPAEALALHPPQDDPIALTSGRDLPLVRSDSDSWFDFVHRMSDYNPHKAHRRLASKRLRLTADWFLENSNYVRWCSEDSGLNSLWCSGRVGCGKTMICTRVVDHQKPRSERKGLALAYFYCDPFEKRTLDPYDVLASLAKQSLEHMKENNAQVKKSTEKQLRTLYASGHPEPDIEDITDILSDVLQTLPSSMYIIDGIHELSPVDIPRLLLPLRVLFQGHLERKLLIFSRDELGHGNSISFASRVLLSDKDIQDDIRAFVESTITTRMSDYQITDNPKVLQHIKQSLLQKARGMFLWVRLQVDSLWRDCRNDEEILNALENLPRNLPETYRRCLEHIPDLTRNYAQKVFQWVMCAVCPLTVTELKEAVAFDLSCTFWDERKLPSRSVVIGSCANLVVEDDYDRKVRFTHPSVKQFLCEPNNSCPKEWSIDTVQGNVQCGEACVNYLSFNNFDLSLNKFDPRGGKVALPTPGSIMTSLTSETLRHFGASFLRASKPAPDPMILNPHLRAATKPVEQDMYGLLVYARQSWAHHTKSISTGSPVWIKFRNLALRPNNVWKLQPWRADELSYTSYLHGVLAWAVREHHLGLLALLMDGSHDSHLKMMCDLPFTPDGLPALHSASRLGSARVVSMLLRVCDVNARGPGSKRAIHFAAEKDHMEVVGTLMRVKSVDLNILCEPCMTALEVAFQHGSKDVACLLLDAVKSKTVLRLLDRLFLLAASAGHVELLKVLQDRHGHLLVKPTKTQAIHAAAQFGYTSVAEFLLRRVVDVNTRNEAHEIPLHTAVRHGQEAMTKLLLDNPHTQTHAANQDGETPMDIAFARADPGMITILATHKYSGVDSTQTSALFRAVRLGLIPVVERLLQCQEIDVNSTTGLKITPLAEAVRLGHAAIVEIILQRPDVNVDISAYTADPLLLWSAYQGHATLVKRLLSRKDLDVNQTDRVREKSLLRAAELGHDEVVELLLSCKSIDVNAAEDVEQGTFDFPWSKRDSASSEFLLSQSRGHRGHTALHLAARNGHLAVVDMLISRKGTDVNAATADGYRPLHLALIMGHDVVVRLLLTRKDIDVDAITRGGKTPLHFAACAGDIVMVALLRDHKDAITNPWNHAWETPFTLAVADGPSDMRTRMWSENGFE